MGYTADVDRNLRVYPIYQVGIAAMFWVPVFFLYFSSIATIEQVLWLEAIYYAAVVVLEVPSGYLSDRLGRRPTLVLAAAALLVAYVVFASTSSFGAFALAQLCVALGMALRSGTDSSLLYESLAECNRRGEMAQVEGRAMSWAFVAGATASVVGGALAGIDPRWAYAASAIAATVALAAALAFREPTRQPAPNPVQQLRACRRALQNPVTRWLTAYVMAMIVLNHVPWELTQPYVAFAFASLDASTLGPLASTPALVGAIGATGMLLAAFVSRRAATVERRLGLWPSLCIAMALQGIVIATLAVVHPVLCLVLTLRSVPRALMMPPLNAAIHARVNDSTRATFLSVQSLAGRLAFAATLLIAAQSVGELDDLTVDSLRRLSLAATTAVVGALALFAWIGHRQRELTRPAKGET